MVAQTTSQARKLSRAIFATMREVYVEFESTRHGRTVAASAYVDVPVCRSGNRIASAVMVAELRKQGYTGRIRVQHCHIS